MQTITTIGFDIAKSVFQVHGVDAAGQVVIVAGRHALSDTPVLGFDVGKILKARYLAHQRAQPDWNWSISDREEFGRERLRHNGRIRADSRAQAEHKFRIID